MIEWAKPVLRTAFAVTVGAVATGAVNVILLIFAIPIGLATGHLLWAVVIAEAALLLGCVVVALVLTLRSRAGLGASLIVGWATAFLGLTALVLAVVAIVAVLLMILVVVWVVVVVVGWLVALLFGSVFG